MHDLLVVFGYLIGRLHYRHPTENAGVEKQIHQHIRITFISNFLNTYRNLSIFALKDRNGDLFFNSCASNVDTF